MSKKRLLETGDALEARVQRLFMCQGAFAERGLFLRTKSTGSRLATDIDVLAHSYSINLHHAKIYAECKGGRNVSTLDRVIWIRGMSDVIGAESAYLVLEACDPESVAFAKKHSVQIIQAEGLQALEGSLRIAAGFWPGRSNLEYVTLEREINKTAGQARNGEFQDWVATAAENWREMSGAILNYGRLNSLVSCLSYARRYTDPTSNRPIEPSVLRYALAALVVRLCQFILYTAADTLNLTSLQRMSYIAERLTAGSHDIEQTKRILAGALRLARARLEESKVAVPGHWDVDHLLTSPSHSRPFAEVVERTIGEGSRARVLPLAMEVRLFGFAGPETGGADLLRRLRPGYELTSTVLAFATQTLGITPEYLAGPASDITGAKTLTQNVDGKHETTGTVSP